MKVQPTLQLESHPSIWAVGDILDFLEGKRATKAKRQLNVLIPNLLLFLRDRNARLTKEYTPSPENIVLTNGAVGSSSSVSLWFCGVLIGDDVLGPIERRNRILRPAMGSDYNLGLDHQALVSQNPDG